MDRAMGARRGAAAVAATRQAQQRAGQRTEANRQAAATGAPPKRAAFFYDAKRQNKKANREGWLFALRRFTLGADNRELVAGVCLSRVFGG